MQLHEIHKDHKHASVRLKVILLVFAIILVGALGYFVWDYNNTPDTTDYSTPKITKKVETKETTEDASTDWKTYTNEPYGFTITLTDAWEGYKTSIRADIQNANIKYMDFWVPCEEGECDSSSEPGYASRMAMSILPLSERDKRLVANDPSQLLIEDELGATEEYAFYITGWQDAPESLADIDFNVEKVKETFVLTN